MSSRVGVALGGGFARGIAHIGVLRVLEDSTKSQSTLSPAPVSEPSLRPPMRAARRSLKWSGRASRRGSVISDVGPYLEWVWPQTTAWKSISTASRRRTFEEMKVPLSIVATNIISGESVHFTDGEIAPALRASCAYPGLFLPMSTGDISW